MTLTTVQQDIYNIINDHYGVRSEEISHSLNLTKEDVRKELSVMVLNGLVNGEVKNGYFVNECSTGLTQLLRNTMIYDLVSNVLVLENPSKHDIMFYQTMTNESIYACSNGGDFESLYSFNGDFNDVTVGEKETLEKLDFSNHNNYTVLDNDKNIVGVITKERFMKYFVEILEEVN